MSAWVNRGTLSASTPKGTESSMKNIGATDTAVIPAQAGIH